MRADIVKHPLLKATYTNLLWKAPVSIKHKNYAVVALGNYRIIEHCIGSFKDDLDQENSFEVTRKFKSLVAQTNETNCGCLK